MKSSSALVLVAAATCAALADAQDGSFSATEKALWVDRHNYFRMTALPFSAGNMLRVKWSDDLAAAALADAKGCAAATGAGVNAHTHAAGASGSVIDAAINEWAVNGAYSALAKIKAPKDGEPVGTGVYNSYSQIVWAATNSVGCGFSTCATGKLVVCKYSAPGNSASEPWYVHAPPNTQCPAGTEGKQGLCVVAGDAGNNDIAPIPAGQNAYAVFASFIGNMHKVLLGQTVDGGPMTGGTGASTNPASTAAPAGGAAATTTTAPSGDAGTTTTTAPSPVVTEAAAMKTPTTAGSSTSDETTTDATTKSPTTTSGSTTGGGAAKSIDFGSLTNTASDAPGKVNAGSNTGTSFSNATPSSGGTSTAAAAASSSAAKSSAKKTESADESVTGGSGTANNKSDGGEATDGSGFSAAGVAGAIVVGCVMVAGVFVFVSYRKNQQRQRDIMQNGGIHIL